MNDPAYMSGTLRADDGVLLANHQKWQLSLVMISHACHSRFARQVSFRIYKHLRQKLLEGPAPTLDIKNVVPVLVGVPDADGRIIRGLRSRQRRINADPVLFSGLDLARLRNDLDVLAKNQAALGTFRPLLVLGRKVVRTNQVPDLLQGLPTFALRVKHITDPAVIAVKKSVPKRTSMRIVNELKLMDAFVKA